MLGTERMLRCGYRLINVYLILQIISMRLFMRGISTGFIGVLAGIGTRRSTRHPRLDRNWTRKPQPALQKGKGPVLANRNGPFLRSEAYCLPPTL